MSQKTTLVPAYLSGISAIAAFLVDPDLSSQTRLQYIAGAARTIPTMQLTPGEVAEVTTAIDGVVGEVKQSDFQYGKRAIEHLIAARDGLVAANMKSRNGHADADASEQVASAQTSGPTDAFLGVSG